MHPCGRHLRRSMSSTNQKPYCIETILGDKAWLSHGATSRPSSISGVWLSLRISLRCNHLDAGKAWLLASALGAMGGGGWFFSLFFILGALWQRSDWSFGSFRISKRYWKPTLIGVVGVGRVVGAAFSSEAWRQAGRRCPRVLWVTFRTGLAVLATSRTVRGGFL